MNKKNKITGLSVFVIMLLSSLFFTSVSASEEELKKRVKRLERITDNPVLIKLTRKLGEQQSEIQQLYDKMDRLQHKINLMETKQNNRYKETDDRFSSIGKTVTLPIAQEEAKQTNLKEVAKVKASTKKKVKTKAKLKVKAIKVRQANKAEKKEYKAAFSLMKKKKYKSSRKAFLKFKKSYPTSSLASNSLYWAGEASLVLNQNKTAVKSFNEVVSLYPKSSKAPGSLLRAGDALKRLNKIKEARIKYKLLSKKYPKSRAAKKVKNRLKKLK